MKGSDKGFASSGIILYLVGFGLTWFLAYAVLGWVMETKEERAIRKFGIIDDKIKSNFKKSDMMKYGVGEFKAKCTGFISKDCIAEGY